MSDINVNASIDVGKNIQGLLEKLAAQIGVTVEHVWPWLVRQQVVEAWVSLAVLAVFMVASATALFVGLRAGKKKDFDEGPWLAAAVPGGIVLVLCTFIAALATTGLVSRIVNPEYAALRELLSMVKP